MASTVRNGMQNAKNIEVSQIQTTMRHKDWQGTELQLQCGTSRMIRMNFGRD